MPKWTPPKAITPLPIKPETPDPFVIGVTGHRYFAIDDPVLTDLVTHELQQIKKNYPAKKYIIVSGLAEGADRLVARRAMRTLSAELIGVLALPPDIKDGFRKDFPQTEAEFDELYYVASKIVTAPILQPEANWRDYTAARNAQYAWVGAYLAEHCHLLMALWDGQPARGTGGTAEVVEWFTEAAVPESFSSIEHISQEGHDPLPPAIPLRLVHINPETNEVTTTDIKATA